MAGKYGFEGKGNPCESREDQFKMSDLNQWIYLAAFS
jgi:uncharacterized protein (UPF0128 family)